MTKSTSPFIPVGAAVDAPRGYAEMCRDRPALCVPGRQDGQGVAANAVAPGASAPAMLVAASWTRSADASGPMADAALAPETRWTAEATARPRLMAAVLGDTTQATSEPRRLPVSTRLRMLEAVDRYVNGNVRQASDLEAHGVADYWTRSGVGPRARGNCKDLAIEKRLELIEQGYPPSDLIYAIVYRPDLGLHAVLVAHTELGDLVLDSRTPEIVLWNHAPYTWIKRQSTEDPSVWNLVDTSQPAQTSVRYASLDRGADRGPEVGMTADRPAGEALGTR